MTDKQDKAEKDSFPASDAPANSGTADAKGNKKPVTDAKPTGTQTSDRAETETEPHR